MRAIAAAVAMAFVATGASAVAEDSEVYDWRDAARKAGLGQDEVELLEKQKLLIAGREYRQVFEPYIKSDVPTFVTSDSVLNAFHVLLEESVCCFERSRADRLRGILASLWAGLSDALPELELPEAEAADTELQARMTIGVALRLLSEATPGATDELSVKLDAEVARVLAASGQFLPDWMGPGDVEQMFLDYSRFRPAGFYDRDPRLAAYYRATAWLQAVPFRVERDRDLRAALLLTRALLHKTGAWNAYASFTQGLDLVLGKRGAVPMTQPRSARKRPWSGQDLAGYREDCLKAWEIRNPVPATRPLAVDLSVLPKPALRVLPSRDLPETRLIELWLTPADAAGRAFSGLHVAAVLGDDFARKKALAALAKPEAEEIERLLDACREPWTADGLHGSYLWTLAALVDDPERDAPKLFASDAWNQKSTNTLLASWAQCRHTWALQARESVEYAGFQTSLAGVVEPDPEFFSRLADLVEASADLFEGMGAFDAALGRQDVRWLLEDYLAFLKSGGGEKALDGADVDRTQINRNRQAEYLLQRLGAEIKRSDGKGALDPEMIDKARAAAEQAIRTLKADAPLQGVLKEWAELLPPPFKETWRRLQRLCRRLEAMAHKQLRGEPWNEVERYVLLEYGKVLAEAMLYGGNAYLAPLDDAPRVATVHADLRVAEAASWTQVAIRRPRSLFVLYPWKGGEALCRGTILPYCEFTKDRRVSDAEWRAGVDVEGPAWMEGLVAPVSREK